MNIISKFKMILEFWKTFGVYMDHKNVFWTIRSTKSLFDPISTKYIAENHFEHRNSKN